MIFLAENKEEQKVAKEPPKVYAMPNKFMPHDAGGGSNFFVILIILVIIAAGAGYAIYYFMSSGDDETNANTVISNIICNPSP